MVVFCAKEPLLSWDLIKKLWEKNKKNNLKYNVRFHVLSNGVALNEDIINYCIKERIMISISLDGKNSHDLYRKFYSNEPSYEYIKNNLKLIPK
jgi:uncharacterized protein